MQRRIDEQFALDVKLLLATFPDIQGNTFGEIWYEFK